MGSRYRSGVAVIVCAFILLGVIGCGINSKKLNDAQARITALESLGVPDSVLTNVRMYIYNIGVNQKLGKAPKVKRYYDSLITGLTQVEEWQKSASTADKPVVESLVASFKEKKGALTGLQLHAADSIIASIEALLSKGWIMEAKQKAQVAEAIFPQLAADEEKSVKARKLLVGTWSSVRTPASNKYKAVEKRLIKFQPDGKLFLVEEMKGQTSEFLREDWKFVSEGTWDLAGDTALLFVAKERQERLVFWNLKEKDGKRQWIKTEKPPYDSSITNGRKDKYLTMNEISKDFKKN